MKDPELRAVSAGARGLWIDMLSLMFESVRRGYLQFNNGKIVSAENLARMTGNSTDDISHWLRELETSGVLSRTDDGTIYSRRQVRDEMNRADVRERVTRHRRNKDVTGDVTAPSVSDSLSAFDLDSKKSESKAKPSREEVRTYCAFRGKGVDPEKWFDHYESNGWRVGRNAMKDWRAAVRTWETNDFGGVNGSKQHASSKQQERSRNIAGSLLNAFAAHVATGDVPDGGECEGGTGRAPEPGVPARVRGAVSGRH